MEFNNIIVTSDANAVEGANGGGSSSSSASNNPVFWYYNDDEELAPINADVTVNSNKSLVIGDYIIEATDNGLTIKKKDGSIANLLVSGDINAYSTL